MIGNMIYPGYGATSKTETFFVEGIKFDLCEVALSHYDYLCPNTTSRNASKPANRFFLQLKMSM